MPPAQAAATFPPVPAGGRGRTRRLLLAGHCAEPDDAALLAVLIAGDGERALLAARCLLAAGGDLPRLSRAAPALLLRQAGVGPAGASRLLAAFELGRRCRRGRTVTAGPVRGPEDVVPLLAERLHGRDREHFVVLHLDARHRVIDMETVAVGCLTASLVHPREVFRGAMQRAAAAVMVAHNHPSGDPTPSGEDRRLTARLDACARLLGIALLDHIVYGDDGWVSLRRAGWPAATEDRPHLAGRAGP